MKIERNLSDVLERFLHGSPLFQALQLEGREVFRFSRHLMHLGPRVLNPTNKHV
jgi:hypothetical protein